MGESDLAYGDIEKALLARFPELRGPVEQTFGSYYDLASQTPEAYPLFEDVLQGLVLQLLKTGEDDGLVRRIFAFFEQMASSSDRNVTDLLGIAILEPLTSDRAGIRCAWKYMGEKTKNLAKQTARSGGWQDNLPPGDATPSNGE